MSKVTTLRKMQVAMKTFRSTYLQPFQIELEQKKSNGNLEKETKHSHASADHLSDIRIGNVDWYICGFCKKEAREIDYF